MKKMITLALFLVSQGLVHANSLLQNPTTGAIPSQTNIAAMGIVSKGSDVALVLGGTGSAYFIDIKDTSTAEAAANTITTIPNFIASKLNAVAGNVVTVMDMVVNPQSRTVYVLAKSGTARYVFRVKNNGANVTLVNLNSVSYAQVNFSTGLRTYAVCWGDNKVFLSAGSFGLNAELNYTSPPFVHNSSFSKRVISMFKSNWGGNYNTDAPLEKLAYGVVKGTKRLAGVTTCAPGFSLNVANMPGSGSLQVTEDFNVHQGFPEKVLLLNHDSKSWLYELHDVSNGSGKLYRIGEQYLDGSKVAANQYNNSATKLRTSAGAIATGITDSQFKLIGNYNAIAYWDNGMMLVLDPASGGGALHLLTVGTTTAVPQLLNAKNVDFSIFPNPSNGETLHITLPKDVAKARLFIYSNDGRLVYQNVLSENQSTVKLATLAAGNYQAKLVTDNGAVGTKQIVIQ